MAINYYVGERVPLYQGLTQAYARGLEGIAQESQRGAEMQYRGVKDITDAIERNKKEQQDAMFRNEQNKIAREKLALDKETFYAGQADKKEMQTQKLEMDKLMQQNALNTKTEWKNLDVATQMALKSMGITNEMQLQQARLESNKEIAGMNITSREKMAKEDRNLKKEMQGITIDFQWDLANLKEDGLDARLAERLFAENSWKQMDNKIKSDVFILDQQKFKEVQKQNLRNYRLGNRKLDLSQEQIQNNYSIAKQNIGNRRKTISLMTKEFNEYKMPLLKLKGQQFNAEREDKAFFKENENLVGVAKSFNQAIHSRWVQASNEAMQSGMEIPSKESVAKLFFSEIGFNPEEYKERRAWLNFQVDMEKVYPNGGLNNLPEKEINELFEDYQKTTTVGQTSYGLPVFDGDFADVFNQTIQEKTLALKEAEVGARIQQQKNELAETFRQFNITNDRQIAQLDEKLDLEWSKLGLSNLERLDRKQQFVDQLALSQQKANQDLLQIAGIQGLNETKRNELAISLGINPEGKTVKELSLEIQKEQSSKLLADSKESLVLATNKVRKSETLRPQDLVKLIVNADKYTNGRELYLFKGQTRQQVNDTFESKYANGLDAESKERLGIFTELDDVDRVSFSVEEIEIAQQMGIYDPENGIRHVDDKIKAQFMEKYMELQKRTPKEMEQYPRLDINQVLNSLGLTGISPEAREKTNELLFDPTRDEIDGGSPAPVSKQEDDDGGVLDVLNNINSQEANAGEIYTGAEVDNIDRPEEPMDGADIDQNIMQYDDVAGNVMFSLGKDEDRPSSDAEDYVAYDAENPEFQLSVVQNLNRVTGGAKNYMDLMRRSNELLGLPEDNYMDLDGNPLSSGMKQVFMQGAENDNVVDLSQVEGLRGLNQSLTLDSVNPGVTMTTIEREIESDLKDAQSFSLRSNMNPKLVARRKNAFMEATIGYVLLSQMAPENSSDRASYEALAIDYANRYKNPLYEEATQ